MPRLLKYLLIFFITILVLALIVFMTLLHTQTGARWVFNYISSEQDPLIKVESIEGTLANELKLSGLQYKDKNIEINVNQLIYKIKDIHWFDLALELELVSIDSVEINIPNTNNDQSSSTSFDGVSLPIEIQTSNIHINKLSLKSAKRVEKFSNIDLNVNAKKQHVNILNFSLKHKGFDVKTTGEIELTALLPFQMNPQWNVRLNDIELSAQGQIVGNLNKVTLNQDVHIQQEDFSGDYAIEAEMNWTKDVPLFNGTLASENTLIKGSNNSDIELKTLDVELSGSLDGYNLKALILADNQTWPTTKIQLNAQGDLESLNFKELFISNEIGQIAGPTKVNWKHGLAIDSDIIITEVNPQFYFAEWPGMIDGTLKMHAKIIDNNQYSITFDAVDISGKLKQQDFKLIGSAHIDNDSIEIRQSYLSFGSNQLTINAVMTDDKIAGDFIAKLNDLSVIDENFKGHMTAEFNLKGSLDNPEISGYAKGLDLIFNDIKVNQFDLTGQGQLNADFTLLAEAKELVLNGQQFDAMKVKFTGELAEHKLELDIDGADYSSVIKASGHWNKQKHSWTGSVDEHQFIRLDIDSHWYLENKVMINIGQDMKVSNSCWSNKKSKGSVCMSFQSQQHFANYQVNLNLDQLELASFKTFMPDQLFVEGALNGQIGLNITNDDVIIDSNIELINGQLRYAENTANEYISNITKAQIKAHHKNKDAFLTTDIQLADGTFVIITTDLFKDANNELVIDGSVNGLFKNSSYLASLSDEIREVKGPFDINGTIKGPLKHPDVSLLATQKEGYLILSQTGGKIENLAIEFENNNTGLQNNQKFNFEISGNTGLGYIKSEGYLTLDTESNWQVQGQVRGENFRLLALSEFELDISPQLDFFANQSKLMLTGEILIPYGKVNIQSLPESAVSESTDVVIHTPRKDEVNSAGDYIIQYNVNAILEKPMSVNALGLTTNVTGSLRVNNIENPSIDALGALQLIDGSYKIYGQTLDISKGELIFDGPLSNPGLNIIASRQSISGDVVAGVELGGTINRLQSSLYSEPALSDLEILSYILSGRGLGQATGTSSEQLAQAAILLGLKKSSPIFSQIQSTFGIDVLTIKDGLTSKDSIIEAGKNINENIYIGYNHGLFNRIGFWVLRYQINKALRLETTQGEEQTVDLIYSRKKK